MLDAWIIEELRKEEELERIKRENENVIRLPLYEEEPCDNTEDEVEYRPTIIQL